MMGFGRNSVQDGSFLDSRSVDIPEKNLLAAVIERAFRDLLVGTDDQKAAALEWFQDRSGDEGGGLTLQQICDMLGYDVGDVWAKIEERANSYVLYATSADKPERPSLMDAFHRGD